MANNVVLVGRLCRDPELRYTQNGKAVARFTLAVNREYSKEKEADFINIVVWGKPAENCGNYLRKGRLTAVTGSMRNNNYEDKNGVKHYNMEVLANRVEFLEFGEKKEKEDDGYTNNTQDEFEDLSNEDIPF